MLGALYILLGLTINSLIYNVVLIWIKIELMNFVKLFISILCFSKRKAAGWSGSALPLIDLQTIRQFHLSFIIIGMMILH